jgi:hypothetical protein
LKSKYPALDLVYYAAVLKQAGMRISPGRHYFERGGTILACFDPRADGDPLGERSFYCIGPFGNKLCFVDERTLFTGGLI